MTSLKYILLFVAAVFYNLYGQEQSDFLQLKTRYGFEIYRKPVVNFNVFVDYNGEDWQPQVLLAAAVQNDKLQFEKSADNYISRIEITAVFQQNGKAVLKQTWTKEITVDNFEDTNLRHAYQYSVFKINPAKINEPLHPDSGQYTCLFESLDQISRKTYKSQRLLPTTADKTDPQVTEITFLLEHPDSTAQLKILPGNSVLDLNRPYFSFFRLRAPEQDTLTVNAEIYKMDGVRKSLFWQEQITAYPDSFGNFSVTAAMPYKSFSEGNYVLRMSRKADGKSLNLEKQFSVIWFTRPVYLYETELAMRPLRYLLNQEEYEKIQGLNKQDLDDWFQGFWKEKDPTPDTEYNELLNEFYQRVSEANFKFSSRFKEGWETDRGMILITYGRPDEIDNRRYSTSKLPHIIWIYKKSDRKFVFVDKNSDDDFTLITNED